MTANASSTHQDTTEAQDRVEWLRTMIFIRRFEEEGDRLALRGKIPGGMHPAVGQEAAAVGAARALCPGDLVTSGHRPHHHALALGTDPRQLMAELFGKADGLVGGRSGSMHLVDLAHGYIGANGIVGAGVGLAMGAALGLKMQHKKSVAVAFFGDGGANTGRTWEFINMAAIWGLPLIAICENNLYAVQTHTDRVTGGADIVSRGAAFGATSSRVDGQDVEAVYSAVAEARERALAEDGGPTFLEVMTYRYLGHETGDRAPYRTDDEIQWWRSNRDPIERLANQLIENGSLTSEDVTGIRHDVETAVAEAISFAEGAPTPDVSDIKPLKLARN